MPDEVRADCLHALLEAGYGQQIMVSHDCVFCMRGRLFPAAREAALAAHSPLTFSRDVAPKLRERGVPQAMIDGLLRDNPRRYFCAEVPQRGPGVTDAAAYA